MPIFPHLSFTIFNDLPGALSSSASGTPQLSLYEKDLVYVYQTSGTRKPWLLTPDIFFIARILDSEYQSRKTYEQLVKIYLIDAEGAISTAPMEKPGFGKEIMSRCAFIPQINIKMVVDFLFWWVEEDQRLRKLCGEKEELMVALQGEEIEGKKLEVLLLQVSMRIAARPSQRNAVVESGSLPAETVAHDLPPYEKSTGN